MSKWLSLISGGILGTCARYALSGVIIHTFGTQFPYGTFIVNLLGCFLVGAFVALSDEKSFFTQDMRLLLITGFCGAFTTFSALVLESSYLIKTGHSYTAFLNVFLSILFGFLIFRCGLWLGNQF
jgi:fluoride exporter